MWARGGVLLAAVLISLVLAGAVRVGSGPGGPEDPGAARAVAVLTGIEDGDLGDTVPEGFAEVMGYRPEPVRGWDGSLRLVKPDGDCSSPLGATRYDFGLACQTHDYGYDLLRYATERGGELGPWARVAIDDLLGEDMRRRCATVEGGLGCRTLVALSEGVVRANSWRQGRGNPARENLGPYVVSGALIGVAVLAWPAAIREGRRAGRRPRIAAAEWVRG